MAISAQFWEQVMDTTDGQIAMIIGTVYAISTEEVLGRVLAVTDGITGILRTFVSVITQG